MLKMAYFHAYWALFCIKVALVTDAAYVNAPILTDCPVSIECSVVESTHPGTHELFVGKVEAVHVDEEYLDANGNIQWDKMDLM